jgi:DNA repair protein RecO (recombination protein O)
LYTREQGKLRAVAKGVRRIRSRKAGHLEPFTRVTLQLARGRDLPIVTQAETVDALLPLHDDLQRLGQAAYIVELLDRFTWEDPTESLPVYRLLTDTLARISIEEDPWLAVHFYEVHLLGLLGYRPMLFECAHCKETVQAVDQYISPLAGGVLCPRCGGNQPGAWKISMDALKFLRHFQRSEYPAARRARVETSTRAEVETILQRYITYLLERELNSPRLIKQLQP